VARQLAGVMQEIRNQFIERLVQLDVALAMLFRGHAQLPVFEEVSTA
jgi:hypothetical protein